MNANVLFFTSISILFVMIGWGFFFILINHPEKPSPADLEESRENAKSELGYNQETGTRTPLSGFIVETRYTPYAPLSKDINFSSAKWPAIIGLLGVALTVSSLGWSLFTSQYSHGEWFQWQQNPNDNSNGLEVEFGFEVPGYTGEAADSDDMSEK